MEGRLLPSTIRWSNPASGDWDTPANWDLNRVPAAADDAVIATAGITVTHGVGTSDAVGSITSQAALALSGGSLDVSGNVQVTAGLTLSGGTLAHATVVTGTTTRVTAAGGTLNGVTLDGDLDLASASVVLGVTGGLTLNGTASLGNSSGSTNGSIRFSGDQTLGGSGSVVFGGADIGFNRLSAPFETVTLATGLTVRGQNGSFLGGNFTNQGTISADTAGGTFTFSTNWRNAGTVQAINGATLTILNGIWSSSGRISETNSTLNLGGSFTTAGLGTFSRSGGAVNLTGTLTNTAATLTLNAATGPWNLLGTIVGGTVVETGGAWLLPGGGTLDGVTLNGDLDLASASRRLNVTGGLTLNGTASLGNSSGSTSGSINFFAGNQTLGGSGSVVFGGADIGQNSLSSDNLTLATGFTVRGSKGFIGVSGVLVNQGTISVDTAGGTIAFNVGSLRNLGTLDGQIGTLRISVTALSVDGSGILAGRALGTVTVNGNLLGATQNADRFVPPGTVLLNGQGTPTAPQLLEVMSQDLGNVPQGFTRNFVYGTLSLGNNNFVRLVDNARNSRGAGPEAVYINTLIVPAAATLDLNQLHLYARTIQVDGMVIGGSINQIPPGPLALGMPAPGFVTAETQVDEWTVFGRAGQAISVIVNTGSLGSPPPVAPFLNFANVRILDRDGNLLAQATNSQSGADVSLLGVNLPADGTYRLQVRPGQAGSRGHYVLTAWDGTITAFPLSLNQKVAGTIDTPFRVNRWTFAAAAGDQVQFDLINASSNSVQFDLSGPNGFTHAMLHDGDLLTLPTGGRYSLSVSSANQQTGSYAFRVHLTTLTDLALGSMFTGTFDGNGQGHLFRVNVPEAKQLLVTLRDSGPGDINELYLKFGSPPTRGSYDYRFGSPASANQQLLAPAAAVGTWYILAYGEVVPSPNQFTLTAVTASVQLNGVTPNHAGNAAAATLTLTGAGFDQTTAVALVAGNGTAYNAVMVSVDLPTQMTATFAAGTVPPGVYTVRVVQPGRDTAELPGAFRIIAGGRPRLNTNVNPGMIGYHVPSTIYVDYSNTGDVAMPAPLLVLDAVQSGRSGAFFTLDQSRVVSGFWTSAVPDGFSHSIQILANGATPGVLQPGESVRVPVYYAGWQQPWDVTNRPPINFQVAVFQPDDPRPIDWNAVRDSLRPPGIGADAWAAVFTNLVAQVGSTWGAYVTMLDANAAYLGRLGEKGTDVSRLWSFQIQQAIGFNPITHLGDSVDAQVPAPGLPLTFSRSFNPSLVGRYELGPLGRGWTWAGGWDQTLAVEADGPVAVQVGAGSQRRFQPDSRGGYFAQAGDRATLTNLGGGLFALRELDGRVTRFRADGRVDSHEDPNGNRITATYTGGRPTRLTHSAGQFLQIDYNAAGRVQFVTDPAGRRTTFTYDPTNEYLMSVQTADGMITRYSYDQGADPLKKYALLSIEYPGKTHEFYGYDARGRLNDFHRDGNAAHVTFDYFLGTVAATDAAKNTTQYSFDDRGLLAKVEDPLAHATHFAFDNGFNLTEVTDAAGQVYHYQYDANGNLSRSTDPLGNTTSFVYAGPFNRLSSVMDPLGYQTQYRYDTHGNLETTNYADGSIEQFLNDPAGDPIQWTNRRGSPVRYQRDTAGRVLKETFADGSHVDYNYDEVRGLLLSATDSTGTTTFRHDDSQHPDQVTRVVYPNGRFLAFQYDAAGRRQQMVDQDGFTTKYRYDAVGRLEKLLDASDNVIVRYTYAPTGLLQRKDLGNGTFTTYTYTPAGQIEHLVNFAPSGAINSRFDYTYDALGRTSTMTTLVGLTVYGYDGAGQLTSVQLPGGRTIQYRYDANGNRTSVTDNGVTTPYVSNNLNQYTAVGSVAYGYDRDGNLISQQDGATLSTYTYDDLNRLIGVVTAAGTWAYQYDPFGNRSAATQNGQRTEYLIDPFGLGNVVGQYNIGGLVADYTNGLGLTSRVDPAGAAAYYDFDALGSTAGLSGAAGAYVNRYSYLPFGERLSSSETVANPFGFVGQFGVAQEGNGLDFMRNRFYGPLEGRFPTPDPSGLAGGINLYAYAENKPLQMSDPLGLFPAPDTCVGASAGAGDGITAGCSCGASVGSGVGVGFGPGCMGPGLYCLGCSCSITIGFYASAGVGGSASYGPSTGGCVPLQPPDPLPPADCPANAPSPDEWGQCCNSFGECAPPPPPPPTPPLPPCDPSITSCVPVPPVTPSDPNDKIGPSGFGPANFVSLDRTFPYRIDFENDARATAPAQRVDVTDQLAATLDWDTFQLTEVGFGDVLLTVPPGSRYFQATVSMTYNGQTFDVQIEVGIRSDTGLVFAIFQSIDPATSLPPDVLTGFLPPEDGTGRGQGHFSYTVRPRAGLPTGTQIRNIALVTFDRGETIATNQVSPHDPEQGTDPAKEALVTIDAAPPTSRVNPLPAQSQPDIFVSWAGRDDTGGSGLAFFDLYVSQDGGPFQPWLLHTTATSAVFHGLSRHRYGFYSVATDNAGNQEAGPDTAQADTFIPKLGPAQFLVTFEVETTTAGTTFRVHVRYVGAFQRDPLDPYLGTIHFLSSDGRGVLPQDYTFTADDQNEHVFEDVVLVRAGAQWVRVTDTVSLVTGSGTVMVTPAAADHFRLGVPAGAASGTAFDITVTALDPYDNVDTNYAGTVTFTSTDMDPGVLLPDAYTFSGEDAGMHAFGMGVILLTLGDQDITVTDQDSGLSGTGTVTISDESAPSRAAKRGGRFGGGPATGRGRSGLSPGRVAGPGSVRCVGNTPRRPASHVTGAGGRAGRRGRPGGLVCRRRGAGRGPGPSGRHAGARGAGPRSSGPRSGRDPGRAAPGGGCPGCLGRSGRAAGQRAHGRSLVPQAGQPVRKNNTLGFFVPRCTIKSVVEH